MIQEDSQIARHKTAIKRYTLSRPVSLLVQKAILDPQDSFFDYGCGHGHDIEILKTSQINATGFDPHFRPNEPLIESDIVNLGYVLNVIENPSERISVLKKAFNLAKKALCVSVMTPLQRGYEGTEYSDGVLSKRGTFQKYFEQDEIKSLIESTLQTDAMALEPGILVAFKEDSARISYLENKLRQQRQYLQYASLNRPPKVSLRTAVIEEIKNSELIQPIIQFMLAHGRFPIIEECAPLQDLLANNKSITHIREATNQLIDQDLLETIREDRKSDLMVFFATRRFDKLGYPKPASLPISTMTDIKEFFPNFKSFLIATDQLLFSVGNEAVVTKAFQACKLGKHLPDAVYIHPSLIPKLPPEIRVLIGLAQSLLGDVPDCNILKLNKVKRKISFMIYEDFDKTPHPALLQAYVVDIPKHEIKLWNFMDRENPPILHRKETFVDKDYPEYNKFVKLTKQEEKADLLSLPSIGTKEGWDKLLSEKGYKVKGHKLEKTKPSEIL